MSVAAADLDLVKSYFEAMFGCVVGCGCWERGWDNIQQLERCLASGELVPNQNLVASRAWMER